MRNPITAIIFFIHWLVFNIWFINILPHPLNTAIILWCLCIGVFIIYVILFYKEEESQKSKSID